MAPVCVALELTIDLIRCTPLLSLHPVAENAVDAAVVPGLVGGVVAVVAAAVAAPVLAPAPSTCRMAGRMVFLQVRRGGRMGGCENWVDFWARAAVVVVASTLAHPIHSLPSSPAGARWSYGPYGHYPVSFAVAAQYAATGYAPGGAPLAGWGPPAGGASPAGWPQQQQPPPGWDGQ